MFKVDELIKATGGKLIGLAPDQGVKAISIDSRKLKPGAVFLAIKGKNFDGHDFIPDAVRRGAGCIICQNTKFKAGRGFNNITVIKVKNTEKALGDIARFHRRRFNIPIIAVTGSNGKTTAKDMIALVLSHKFMVLKNEGTKNNQIGLPMTLLGLRKNHDAVVLELGTNHFGEIGYLSNIAEPNIGIIANIGPSHLEYLKSLDDIFREKYALIESLCKPRIAILNADDVFLGGKTSNITAGLNVFGFGINKKSDFYASAIRNTGKGIEFLVGQRHKFRLRTLGEHNVYNALIAISVARIFGMDYKDISRALSEFDFPKGRLNFIGANNTRFIDDTYNSNPLSFDHALKALANFKTKGRKIILMGDMLELGPGTDEFHYQAGRAATRVCDILVAVGKLSRLSATAARKCGLDSRNIFTCDSSLEARDILMHKITPDRNDIVLVKGSRMMKMEDVFKGSSK